MVVPVSLYCQNIAEDGIACHSLYCHHIADDDSACHSLYCHHIAEDGSVCHSLYYHHIAEDGSACHSLYYHHIAEDGSTCHSLYCQNIAEDGSVCHSLITRTSEWVITLWRSCELFLRRDISWVRRTSEISLPKTMNMIYTNDHHEFVLVFMPNYYWLDVDFNGLCV